MAVYVGFTITGHSFDFINTEKILLQMAAMLDCKWKKQGALQPHQKVTSNVSKTAMNTSYSSRDLTLRCTLESTT